MCYSDFIIIRCWAASNRPASPVFAQLQDQRKSLESASETQWFNGWGKLAWLKQGPGVASTPAFTPFREREVTSYRGTDNSWLIVYQGNQQWACPSLPLWSPSGDIQPKAINKTITGLSLGVKRPVTWVGYMWSRHWLSRKCTETKRPAILSALIIHKGAGWGVNVFRMPFLKTDV